MHMILLHDLHVENYACNSHKCVWASAAVFARTVESTHFAFGSGSKMHMYRLNKHEGHRQVLPCDNISP